MSKSHYKSPALNRLRDVDQFPREGETWLDYMDRREKKIEADRRFARRVFVILATMITFALLVHEAYLVLAK